MKNKLFKKLPLAVLGLGAMLTAVSPVMAQPPANGDKTTKREHRGQRGDQLQKLSEALNLTEDQKTQLKPIFEDARTRSQAVRQNAQLTPEEKSQQTMQIRKETQEKVSAILTPEQREKLKEIRKQQRAARQAKPQATAN
jgi:Spy/CpxP family protein refolding chaperone